MATDFERVPRVGHDGILSRAALQLRQLMCGLHGHDTLMHFDHGHISLLCTSCGYETPGWDVAAAEPRREAAQSPNDISPRVVRLPLIEERRVA